MSRQQYGLESSGVITEEVRKFLILFRQNVARGSAKALYSSYQQFNQITEKTYQVSTWPSSTAVVQELQLLSQQEDTDKIFVYLYRELYYRHAFNRCDISVETMHESFQNYVNLFNLLLEYYDEDRKFAEIPNVWLWECIQSFVSQFQYYHHWKSDNSKKYENLRTLYQIFGELDKSKQKLIQQKWNVQVVLRYLHYLVSAAKIPIRYNEPPDVEPGDDEEKGGGPGSANSRSKAPSIMMQMLGTFSLIGLSRIHCMLGDYRTAIDVMDCVDLKAKVKYFIVFSTVIIHTSLHLFIFINT